MKLWLLFVICWLVKALATVGDVLGSNEAEGQLTYRGLPLVVLCKECFEQPAASEQSFLVRSFPNLF